MAFKCPSCGGNLYYNIHRGKLKCEHCNSEIAVKNYQLDNKAEESSDEYGVTAFICRNCGAELLSPDNSIVSYCSYCGGEATLESRMDNELKPEFIIPFHQTKEKCKEAFRKRTSRLLYLPNKLKNTDYLERFRGTYIPYWMYRVDFPDEVKISATKTIKDGKYYVESEYDVMTQVEGDYQGIPYDASSCFDDTISDMLMPFEKKDLKTFHPGYMAGFYADRADVPAERYANEALEKATEYAFNRIERQVEKTEFLEVGIHSHEAKKSALKAKIGDYYTALFPVWFLTYKNKDRVAYAIVNGQNGRVSSDMPVDLKQYAVGAGIMACIIFALMTIFVSMTARTALAICAILSAVVLGFLSEEIRTIRDAENHVKDRGYFVRGRDVAMPYEKRRRVRASNGIQISFGRIISVGILSTCLIVPIMLFSGILFAMAGDTNPSTQLFMVSAILLVVSIIVLLRGLTAAHYIKEKHIVKFNILAFIGIVIAFLVSIWNPVDDVFYYAGCIICALCAATASVGMVKYYNLVTTRPIPSFFDREGGNDKPEREEGEKNKSINLNTIIAAMLSVGVMLTVFFGNGITAYAEDLTYVNPNTGYKAFIVDEEDLLTPEEESRLLTTYMVPVTEFGDVGFITCYATASSTRREAENRYVEYIGGGKNGTVLVIDMNYRIIQIASDGAVYKIITKAQANAITDNSYKYASNGDYYGCAADIFKQEERLLRGGQVPQPMKHISNILVAITLSILINYMLVLFQRKNSDKVDEHKIFNATTVSSLIPSVVYTEKVSERRYKASSDSGGGSFGGGGGFSGGGGSSGGGGGFSGGGGGHSF